MPCFSMNVTFSTGYTSPTRVLCPVSLYASFFSGMSTDRIVFRPSDCKCSKLPNRGKLLRYRPGIISPKLMIGPLVGEGGPLFSKLGAPGLLACAGSSE